VLLALPRLSQNADLIRLRLDRHRGCGERHRFACRGHGFDEADGGGDASLAAATAFDEAGQGGIAALAATTGFDEVAGGGDASLAAATGVGDRGAGIR
jgi:hypothetical protein